MFSKDQWITCPTCYTLYTYCPFHPTVPWEGMNRPKSYVPKCPMISLPDCKLDIPASSNPKLNVLTMAILKLLFTWYTWQTDGWSTCMHVLYIANSQCWNSISSCHKYQTQDKVQQTSASFPREWMLVNTARKAQTQVREEWKKAIIWSLCGSHMYIECCKFACWYISPIAQASFKCVTLYLWAYQVAFLLPLKRAPWPVPYGCMRVISLTSWTPKFESVCLWS